MRRQPRVLVSLPQGVFVSLLAAGMFLVCGRCLAAEDPLGKAEALYLQKLYVQAIEACQEVIQERPGDAELSARANYLTGACYVNLFDFLTAKKNFQTIVDQYKNSAHYEDAYLGLADVEFLQENFDEALKVYQAFLEQGPSPKRRATLYFRLAEVYLKKGDVAASRQYLAKLRQEFPDSFEARDAGRMNGEKVWYTVQVGAFTDFKNAEAFVEELKAKGYDVYSVLCLLAGKKLCRVRIGKFAGRREAEALQEKLTLDGHYSKVVALTARE